MIIIFFIILGIALLDTLFGNRIFPGRVGVVYGAISTGSRNISYWNRPMYYVFKWHRIFFIPVKLWYVTIGRRPTMADFSRYIEDAEAFHDENDAIDEAKRLANQFSTKGKELSPIWDSKQSKIERSAHKRIGVI